MSKKKKKADTGIYKSKFEMDVATKMPEGSYECEEIEYQIPATTHKYTPDFVTTDNDGHKIYWETKGRYRTKAEADKYLWIRDSNPNIDIRFIIMDPKTLMPNCKKTTMADWLKKNNFTFYVYPDIPKKLLNKVHTFEYIKKSPIFAKN